MSDFGKMSLSKPLTTKEVKSWLGPEHLTHVISGDEPFHLKMNEINYVNSTLMSFLAKHKMYAEIAYKEIWFTNEDDAVLFWLTNGGEITRMIQATYTYDDILRFVTNFKRETLGISPWT